MTVIQNKLEKTKRSHIQNVQPRSELSTNHRPPSLLKQAPSYYEETISSIEKWLIEGDLDKRKTKGNQVNTSPLTEQMQNEERHVTHILFTSFESSQAECSTSSTIQSSTKKSLKWKRKRISKWFDSSDGREQLDIRIRHSYIMQDRAWHIWKTAHRLPWKQANAQHALYWTHLMPHGILCILYLTLHFFLSSFHFVVRVDLLFMLSRIINERRASIFRVLNVICWYLDGRYLCNLVCCLDIDFGFSHSSDEATVPK